jgi:hypothetical protein
VIDHVAAAKQNGNTDQNGNKKRHGLFSCHCSCWRNNAPCQVGFLSQYPEKFLFVAEPGGPLGLAWGHEA